MNSGAPLALARTRELLALMRGKRVVVFGDLMLDRYIWGVVGRISPEAPVPVVRVEEESSRLGGAANVVSNLRSLGADVIPVGVVGDDGNGELVKGLVQQQSITSEGIVTEAGRTTTTKTRVIAHNQHVVRVDREMKKPIQINTQQKVLRAFQSALEGADAVIFQDYNKGLLTPQMIRVGMDLAARQGIMTAVDPKSENFFEYRGARLFKPNRKETEAVLGRSLQGGAALRIAGEELLRRLGCRYLLITLGEDGLCLLSDDSSMEIVPTKARKVADVSGAGDTVISTATLALSAGGEPLEVATLANYAAGVVCGEVGVVPIEPEDLLRALETAE